MIAFRGFRLNLAMIKIAQKYGVEALIVDWQLSIVNPVNSAETAILATAAAASVCYIAAIAAKA